MVILRNVKLPNHFEKDDGTRRAIIKRNYGEGKLGKGLKKRGFDNVFLGRQYMVILNAIHYPYGSPYCGMV